MTIFIWLLTFILVIDCLLLTLLVLIQLPKKEAGLGQAFGGGATDALFGAGSGNALTKLTKYAAGAFFVLTLFISILFNRQSRMGSIDTLPKLSMEEKLQMAVPGTQAQTNAAAAAAKTNATSLLSVTNAPKK
jgi:preprotein translocase subunit SecG